MKVYFSYYGVTHFLGIPLKEEYGNGSYEIQGELTDENYYRLQEETTAFVKKSTNYKQVIILSMHSLCHSQTTLTSTEN
jgi:hypothetical protein